MLNILVLQNIWEKFSMMKMLEENFEIPILLLEDRWKEPMWKMLLNLQNKRENIYDSIKVLSTPTSFLLRTEK